MRKATVNDEPVELTPAIAGLFATATHRVSHRQLDQFRFDLALPRCTKFILEPVLRLVF